MPFKALKNLTILMLSTFVYLFILESCSKNNLPDESPDDSNNTSDVVKAQHLSYYIDTTGSDTNDGLSPEKSWKTLKNVNNKKFQPGDKILLKSGQIWSGNLAPLGSGTIDSIIEINKFGSGSQLPIINGLGVSGISTVALSNQSFWKISNLEITNKNTTNDAVLKGIGISGSDSIATSNIEITGCYVHDVQSASISSSIYSKISGGILFSGPVSNILVFNNHIKDCMITGIRTASTPQMSSVVIDSNLIENVYGDGIVLAGVKDSSKIIRNRLKNVCYSTESANFAGAWTIRSTQTLIAYNEISGITGGGANDGQPFDADLTTDGDVFEYNYSHDNKKGFILLMPSAKNIIVRYNLSLRDNGVANKYQKRRLINNTSTSTNNLFYNNTFVIDTTLDYIFESGFTGEFTNNIIYSSDSIKKLSGTTITKNGSFYRNCFFTGDLVNSLPTQANVIGNISDNPLLVNPNYVGDGRLGGVQNALSLQSSSPCVTNGSYVESNEYKDYVGNNVTNKSFMGAIMPANAPDYQLKYMDVTTQEFSILNTSSTTADTYVDQTNSSTNYGTNQMVYVKAGGANTTGIIRNGLLKFNTSNVKLDSLKNSNYKVIVRIKAFKKEDTSPNIGLQMLLINSNTWAENTVTYLTKPTFSSSIVSVPNSGLDLTTSQFATLGGEYIDFDITNYLKVYYAALKLIPSVLSLGIQSYSSTTTGNYIGNTGVQFYSKENGIDSLTPRLLTGIVRDSIIKVPSR